MTYNIALCKRKLTEKGWDQKALADKELSESVISKFFRGENVRAATAVAIVKKLGLRMADVIIDEHEAVGIRRRA